MIAILTLVADSPRAFGDVSQYDRKPATKGRLLKVRDLVTRFPVRKGVLQRHVANLHTVENVSSDLGQAETLSLVGESGCGKSRTGRSILRLIEPDFGAVELAGENMLALDGKRLQAPTVRHADRLPGTVCRPRPAPDRVSPGGGAACYPQD